jgi:hypothetical protein
LQRAVAQYLQMMAPMHGFFWCHYPAGGWRSKAEAGILKAMGVKPGVADILIIKDSRAYWIELKAPKGRQSESQRAFEVAILLNHCPYEVARSLDEVIGICRGWSITA